jgi:hypothetical protein
LFQVIDEVLRRETVLDGIDVSEDDAHFGTKGEPSFVLGYLFWRWNDSDAGRLRGGHKCARDQADN